MKQFKIKNWKRYQIDRGKQWVKLETAIITDPKLSLLTASDRYVWVGVLCLAKIHGNSLPFSDEYVSKALGIQENEVALVRFLDLEMISDADELELAPIDYDDSEEDEADPLPAGFAADVVQRWNAGVTTAKVRSKLTGGRLDALRARYREHGASAILDAIDNRVRSKFLNEFSNGRGASFDWVFGPNNFQKVLDGNYNEPDDALPKWVKSVDELEIDDLMEADKCIRSRGLNPEDIGKAQKIETLYNDIRRVFRFANENEHKAPEGVSIAALFRWYESKNEGRRPGGNGKR